MKREALEDQEYTLRLNLAIVRSMDAACRQRGITFILAVFPNATYFESTPTLAGRFLDSLQAEGVPMRRAGLVGLLVGHAITSQVLEREIASRTRRAIATSPDY